MPAADLLRGDRLVPFEELLDAKIARIVPATKTDRLIRKRRLENACG
jgi:hypothetical protein